MFERYTESARRSLFFARYEASQLGSISIEPEHMLLGLMREGAALTAILPVPLDGLRQEIEGRIVFREKLSTSVEIPFSAKTKRMLQFAAEEADRLQHDHIGSEHLLLGLLREEHSIAASILATHGVRLSDVRRDVEKLPVPLEASAEPVIRFQSRSNYEIAASIHQIKSLVEELARAPRDSGEAEVLVQRIHASLDALLNG